MTITPNYYPATINELYPHTAKFEEEIDRGLAIATELSNFTTLIPPNSRRLEDIQAVIDRRLGDSRVAIDSATVLVCLGEVANASRLESELSTKYSPLLKLVDYRLLTAFNHSLRSLVCSATGTDYQSNQLYETMIDFAQNYGYVQGDDNVAILMNNIYDRILSAWCEQNIFNLFKEADVPVKIADIDEDVHGRDALIATNGSTTHTWVSLDFKSFFGTLKTDAEASNLSIHNIHTVSSRGVDKDDKVDRSGDLLDPVWFVLRKDKYHQIHYAMALDIGRTHWDNLPQKLAPNEYVGQGNGVASVEELLKYLSEDVIRNPHRHHLPLAASSRLGQMTVRSGFVR
jgi:hypothetical protein